jgi:hypothetical protein
MKNYLFTNLLIIVVCSVLVQEATAEQENKQAQQENYQQSLCSNNIVLSLSVLTNCIAGEAVPLVISLKNQGDTNVYFVRGTLFCYDSFEIKLLNSEGKTVPFSEFGKMYPPGSVENFGRRGFLKLAPGKEIMMHVNLARIFDLSVSGEYVFSIKTVVGKNKSLKYDPGDTILKIDNFKISLSEPYNESEKIFRNPDFY